MTSSSSAGGAKWTRAPASGLPATLSSADVTTGGPWGRCRGSSRPGNSPSASSTRQRGVCPPANCGAQPTAPSHTTEPSPQRSADASHAMRQVVPAAVTVPQPDPAMPVTPRPCSCALAVPGASGLGQAWRAEQVKPPSHTPFRQTSSPPALRPAAQGSSHRAPLKAPRQVSKLSSTAPATAGWASHGAPPSATGTRTRAGFGSPVDAETPMEQGACSGAGLRILATAAQPVQYSSAGAIRSS
mmetsp:Transcript_16067/g.46889  ORF Transcript_16067/g.46889 Transcript_16067/m.46889 type:complete len:243 (-) Transcript_16067:627-1355(-)